jgi:hypothetical protein
VDTWFIVWLAIIGGAWLFVCGMAWHFFVPSRKAYEQTYGPVDVGGGEEWTAVLRKEPWHRPVTYIVKMKGGAWLNPYDANNAYGWFEEQNARDVFKSKCQLIDWKKQWRTTTSL